MFPVFRRRMRRKYVVFGMKFFMETDGKTLKPKNMETIEWGALGFDYTKTDVNARYSFTGGKWSDMEITADEYIRMHMSASCLHYGIELL